MYAVAVKHFIIFGAGCTLRCINTPRYTLDNAVPSLLPTISFSFSPNNSIVSFHHSRSSPHLARMKTTSKTNHYW